VRKKLKLLAQLIEDHMTELGLSEEEKNQRTDAFVADVARLKAKRSAE
jgi:hypothetical protein